MNAMQKLYIAILSIFTNFYDLYINPISKIVTLKNAKVNEDGTVEDVTLENMAKVKGNFEEWKNSAKNIMQYPFEHTVLVDGDVNTFYPIRLESGCREPFNINIQRYYDAPFPASLGASHVGGLSLTLECCQYGWADFSFTKIKNFIFSYHQTVAKITPYQIGRMLWLRGGGFEYKIKSNYDITVSSPMMTTTTFNLGGYSEYPYTVSPIMEVDSMFASNILTDTLI